MKAIMCFLLLVSFLLSPGFGVSGQADVPVFTEQDLEKYRSDRNAPDVSPSDSRRSRGPANASQEMTGPQQRRFEVPYTAVERGARRIIIPVTLNGSVTVPMALDTGSPGMIISDSLASRLGIFQSDEGKLMVTASGIGGKVPAVLTVIESVRVGGADDQFVPTIITTRLSDAFEGLVGMDFMANYTVFVDTARHTVVFTELPKSSQRPAGHDENWWRSYFRAFAQMRTEWKTYRENLSRSRENPETLQRLRTFADKQYREADKLFNALNGYAIRNSVPMYWREF